MKSWRVTAKGEVPAASLDSSLQNLDVWCQQVKKWRRIGQAPIVMSQGNRRVAALLYHEAQITVTYNTNSQRLWINAILSDNVGVQDVLEHLNSGIAWLGRNAILDDDMGEDDMES